MGRWGPASDVGIVEQIIMEQGRSLEKLKGGAQVVRAGGVRLATVGPKRPVSQGCSQPFAAPKQRSALRYEH
jgi:hypothetical protein